jgi:hypothetical protein
MPKPKVFFKHEWDGVGIVLISVLIFRLSWHRAHYCQRCGDEYFSDVIVH